MPRRYVWSLPGCHCGSDPPTMDTGQRFPFGVTVRLEVDDVPEPVVVVAAGLAGVSPAQPDATTALAAPNIPMASRRPSFSVPWRPAEQRAYHVANKRPSRKLSSVTERVPDKRRLCPARGTGSCRSKDLRYISSLRWGPTPAPARSANSRRGGSLQQLLQRRTLVLP